MTIRIQRPDRYKAGPREQRPDASFAFTEQTRGEALAPSIAVSAGSATGEIHVGSRLKQASRDQYDVYYKSGLYDER